MRKNSKMIAFVMAIAMTVSVSLTSCNLPGGSNSASVENPYNEGGDQTLLAAADEAETVATTAATTAAPVTTTATTTAPVTTVTTTEATTAAPVTTTVVTVKATAKASSGSTKATAAPTTVATAKATATPATATTAKTTATPATAVTTTAPVTTTAKATVATTKSTTAAPATTTVATTKSTTAETTVATITTTTTATTAETTVATTTATTTAPVATVTTTAPVATTVTTTAETTVKILAASEVDWTRYTDNQDILITLRGFKEYIPLIALMNDNTEYNEVEKWHIISGQWRSLIFNHEYAIRTYKGDEVYHKTTLTPVTTEAIVVLTLEDDEIMMSPEAIVEMLDCFFVGEKSERITSSSAVEEFYATGNPSVFS